MVRLSEENNYLNIDINKNSPAYRKTARYIDTLKRHEKEVPPNTLTSEHPDSIWDWTQEYQNGVLNDFPEIDLPLIGTAKVFIEGGRWCVYTIKTVDGKLIHSKEFRSMKDAETALLQELYSMWDSIVTQAEELGPGLDNVLEIIKKEFFNCDNYIQRYIKKYNLDASVALGKDYPYGDSWTMYYGLFVTVNLVTVDKIMNRLLKCCKVIHKYGDILKSYGIGVYDEIRSEECMYKQFDQKLSRVLNISLAVTSPSSQKNFLDRFFKYDRIGRDFANHNKVYKPCIIDDL